MKSFQKEYVMNLPDAFKKTRDSNNYKILEVEKVSADETHKALADIDGVLDFEKATGKTLDYYGSRVGQVRGSANDSQYLMLIKGKILQNRVNGSYRSISEALCFLLDCEAKDINIVDDDAPRTVNIESIPLHTLLEAGMSINQTIALIKRLLPVNIILKDFLVEGTFEFGEYYDYDENKGLSVGYGYTVNDNAIGGYLGDAGSAEDETILPI